MKESTAREKVLKKVRNALVHKIKNPFPLPGFDKSILKTDDEVPELVFAQKFSEAGGNFIFCENAFEFADALLTLSVKKKWKNIICTDEKLSQFLTKCAFPHKAHPGKNKIHAQIILCEYLVATTGSIVLSNPSSENYFEKKLPHISPTLIIYATISQLTSNLKNAFELIKTKYENLFPSILTLITGSGKANDNVNTDFDGIKEIFLFLVDDLQPAT